MGINCNHFFAYSINQTFKCNKGEFANWLMMHSFIDSLFVCYIHSVIVFISARSTIILFKSVRNKDCTTWTTVFCLFELLVSLNDMQVEKYDRARHYTKIIRGKWCDMTQCKVSLRLPS